jgi:hypothetical protein
VDASDSGRAEFDRRNVKIIGLSADLVTDHARWAADIEETQGHAPNYPVIGDADFNVSKLYGMLPADTSGDPKARTPADDTGRIVPYLHPATRRRMLFRGALRRTESPEGAAPYRALRSTGFDKMRTRHAH